MWLDGKARHDKLSGYSKLDIMTSNLEILEEGRKKNFIYLLLFWALVLVFFIITASIVLTLVSVVLQMFDQFVFWSDYLQLE